MSASDKPPIILEHLAKLSPFDNIDSQLLSKLAEDIEISSAKRGTLLFSIGDYDPNDYYLLDGSIKLLASDGREKVISAGDSSARFPIARLRPRIYTASANSDIRYFVVNDSVLEELLSSRRLAGSNLIVQNMQREAGEESRALLYEVEQDLHRGRFVLPSLPEVAFRIREMIDKQDCSMAELAKLVNTDPAIAAKLVKIANSVMYRGVSGCDDTQSAISRLGLITTRQLVTSFAVLELFKTNSSLFKYHMTLLWRQSIEVAAYSYVLAKQLPSFNEEEGMLAGLLHNIGELVVLSYAERFYDLSTCEKHLNITIASMRGPLGAKVLDEWGFSEDLVEVARHADHWLRDSDEDIFDYCDLVQVATLYALQGDEGNPSLPDMHSVPAFNKLKKRHLSEEQISSMVQEAQLQIAELREIFTFS